MVADGDDAIYDRHVELLGFMLIGDDKAGNALPKAECTAASDRRTTVVSAGNSTEDLFNR